MPQSDLVFSLLSVLESTISPGFLYWRKYLETKIWFLNELGVHLLIATGILLLLDTLRNRVRKYIFMYTDPGIDI